MAVLGTLLIALGVVIAGIALALKARALRQRAWRKVPGVVVSTDVKLVRENYAPAVEYTYKVNGKMFRGTRIRSLLVTSNLRTFAQRVTSEYESGAALEVYVDPDCPAEAVLEPGGDPGFLLFMFAIALPLIAVGIATLVVG